MYIRNYIVDLCSKTKNMYEEFSSSMLLGGAGTTPQRIIISDKLVTFKQNNGARSFFLASHSVTISRNAINGIQIHGKLFGCDITITTNGGASIHAQCFSRDDAEDIQRILLGN